MLRQTDACLAAMAARLRSAMAAAGAAPPAQQAAAGAPTADSSDEAAAGGEPALGAGSAEWAALAGGLTADIPSQPALLSGGRLREYQMQARARATVFCAFSAFC